MNKKIVKVSLVALLIFIGVVFLSNMDILNQYSRDNREQVSLGEEISFSNPIDQVTSGTVLQWKTTDSDYFMKYVDLDVVRINDTYFVFIWKINNDSFYDDLSKTYYNDMEKNEFKDKYFESGTDMAKFESQLNKIENVPINKTERIPGNIYISETDFNLLDGGGEFYVKLNQYSVGEKISMGFETITIITVESANSVGFGSAIAIDSTGIVYISHIDDTNKDLRCCNDSLGTWNCSIANDLSDGQLQSSIAIDSNDVVHVVGIDSGASFAIRYCNNTGGTWACETAETSAAYKAYPSIAVDTDDKIHIIYSEEDNHYVRYCNNTNGWACGNIVATTTSAIRPAMAINSTGVLHITYYDYNDGSPNRFIGYCNSAGGVWTCTNPETADRYGKYSSIAIDTNDIVHISFDDALNDNLRYCNNTGGTWSCSVVESTGDVGSLNSIALDSSNFPHFVHYDADTADANYCNTTDFSTFNCETAVEGGVLNVYGRGIAIKKGRLADSSTFSNDVHISFGSGNLIYANLSAYALPPPITPTMSLTGISNITYPTSSTVVCGSDGDGTLHLWRNDTEVDGWNNSAQTYPATAWLWKCNITAGSTHGSGTKSILQTIGKKDPAVDLLLNGSSTNHTTLTNTSVNITITATGSDDADYINCYIDDVIINKSDSPLYNMSKFPGSEGTAYKITAEVNGTGNYSQSSETFYVIMRLTSPTYTKQADNVSATILKGAPVEASAQWTDNGELDFYWLAHDHSGAYVNGPATAFSAGNWSNVTISTTSFYGGSTVSWKIYANDTTGNESVTSVMSFTVNMTVVPIIEEIESSDNIGPHSSTAIDLNNIIHVSHQDITDIDARYCNNTGGSWSCTAIDTDDQLGEYTSIALDSMGVSHVSHCDDQVDRLRYCNNTGGSWSCVTVESGTNICYFTSIAIDSNDKVHISERDVGNGRLRYCNNTAGFDSWSCVAVDADANYGKWSSIGIDSNDDVHISHVGGSVLRYCTNTGGSWSCEVADAASGAGVYSSLAIDRSDIVHISHYADVADDLRYCNNTGGSWSCVSVDTAGNTGEFSSIAVDFARNVHIVHYGNQDLRYCNVTATDFSDWSCTKLADLGPNFYGTDRWLAIKKGVLATSTSYSYDVHMTYWNESGGDLYYLRIAGAAAGSNVSTCALTGVSDITYGTSSTIGCYCYGDGTTHLWRDDIQVDGWNNSAQTYPAGAYQWVCNITDGAVYNATNDTDSQTIGNGTLSFTLIDKNVTTPTKPLTNATESNSYDGGCTYYLIRNDTIVDSTDPWQDAAALDIGAYLYRFNGSGCGNYSADATGVTSLVLVLDIGLCSVPGDCSPANCVDGYCCDTNCTDTCKSCGLAGVEGICNLIADGSDPDEECGVLDCGAAAETSYYYGWRYLSCHYRAGVSATNNTCDGAGACYVESDLCPLQAYANISGDNCACNDSQAGCTGTTDGSCDDTACSNIDIFLDQPLPGMVSPYFDSVGEVVFYSLIWMSGLIMIFITTKSLGLSIMYLIITSWVIVPEILPGTEIYLIVATIAVVAWLVYKVFGPKK